MCRVGTPDLWGFSNHMEQHPKLFWKTAKVLIIYCFSSKYTRVSEMKNYDTGLPTSMEGAEIWDNHKDI
jgi:hypothetical protein